MQDTKHTRTGLQRTSTRCCNTDLRRRTGGANFILVTKGQQGGDTQEPSYPAVDHPPFVDVCRQGDSPPRDEERADPLEEVAEFAEGGLCGTAAVISPIGSITRAKA
jgi:branched-chain amino acid aminotransferase